MCGDRKYKEDHPGQEKNIPDRHDQKSVKLWCGNRKNKEHPGQEKNIPDRHDRSDQEN